MATSPLIRALCDAIILSHDAARPNNADPKEARLAEAARDVLVQTVLTHDPALAETLKFLMAEQAVNNAKLLQLLTQARPAPQATVTHAPPEKPTALPPHIREIILNEPDSGKSYLACMEELRRSGLTADYHLTEIINYNVEITDVLRILAEGRPASWWNYYMEEHQRDEMSRLQDILNPFQEIRLAFAGSGPYPITAFQLKETYPKAEVVCIDNDIFAYRLGQAVSKKAGMELSFEWAEAIEMDYRPFNVVFIAAMLRGKRELIEKILKESDALVIVRGKLDMTHERVVLFDGYPYSDGGVIQFKG